MLGFLRACLFACLGLYLNLINYGPAVALARAPAVVFGCMSVFGAAYVWTSSIS